MGSIRADAPPPVYVVDGRERASIEALDTSTIDTIEVINSTEAVARYGSRAATGAVLITTRSPGRRPVPDPGSILSIELVYGPDEVAIA